MKAAHDTLNCHDHGKTPPLVEVTFNFNGKNSAPEFHLINGSHQLTSNMAEGLFSAFNLGRELLANDLALLSIRIPRNDDPAKVALAFEVDADRPVEAVTRADSLRIDRTVDIANLVANEMVAAQLLLPETRDVDLVLSSLTASTPLPTWRFGWQIGANCFEIRSDSEISQKIFRTFRVWDDVEKTWLTPNDVDAVVAPLSKYSDRPLPEDEDIVSRTALLNVARRSYELGLLEDMAHQEVAARLFATSNNQEDRLRAKLLAQSVLCEYPDNEAMFRILTED